MDQPVIRTVTLGLGDPHPLAATRIERAAAMLDAAREAFHDAGYEVQTVRITTRSVFDDLDGPPDRLMAYAGQLQRALEAAGIDHFSLGAVDTTRPDFPLDRLAVIEDLVAELPAISCAALIATAGHGVRAEAALPVASTVLRIAERTEGAVGNFRFAALAHVEPGCPFFPAGYHRGPDALTIGLQGAGVVAGALAGSGGQDPAAITERVRSALVAAATPVVRLGQRIAEDSGVDFGGVDLSPAPSVGESVGEAVEHAVAGRFGAPGTIAVVGAITRALRSTGLPTCGYNGLMLPVLEDRVLAREWEAGALTAHQLLAYSSICGTGLDTVPLPDGTSARDVAGLLLDVATLANRLSKPLSARLFPLPGVGPGDRTAFGSPHLIDIRLPGGA